jgi:hypothetical protein
MGEHVYSAEGMYIIFSEHADIGCLCTFPHNDSTNKGKFKVYPERVMELALLGCAVALLHNGDYIERGSDKYVYLPSSIEPYASEIIKWFKERKLIAEDNDA